MPRAYIVHRLRGRLRLRVPDRRDDDDFFDEVRDRLEPLPEGVAVRINPGTGSILFLHPSIPDADIENWLGENGVFELADEPPAPPGGALAPLIAMVSKLNGAIAKGTAGRVDLRTILFILAVVLAVRQLARGQVLGPAVPLLWIALELAGRIASFVARPTEADVAEQPENSHLEE